MLLRIVFFSIYFVTSPQAFCSVIFSLNSSIPYSSEIDFASILGNIGSNINCPICRLMKLMSEMTMSLSDRIAQDHLNSG